MDSEVVREVLEDISEVCKGNPYCDGVCPYYNHEIDECAFRYSPDHWELDEI